MTDAPPLRRARLRRHLVRASVVTLVLAVVVGGIVWWVDQGRHYVFPKNWGVVEEGRIYRSGRIYAGLVEDTLRDHDIRVIVDLAGSDPESEDTRAEREAAKKLGIRRVEMHGLGGFGTGAVEEYVEALHEIVKAREAEEPILVHCGGGSERTGGVFAIYRMIWQGWDGATAWEEYKSYRMKPPDRTDLPDFVNGNLPGILDRLEALGVPVERPDPLPHFGPAQEGETP